jgi:UDP-N-acetylmuramoyl-tripeptide--D-alanyl-D-alanine ligase
MAFLLITFASMISIESLYAIYRLHPDICTDSRTLKAGDLFFALKGENYNGNRFALRALEQGAAYAVVDEAPDKPSERILLVRDSLSCLQDLAAHHRNQFDIPFIAVTGSNGKTTTKELMHAVLSTVYKTYTTQGNLNNHIGIPLTLLKIKPDAEMAVVEMGANHQKEIEGYCRYTRPTHGIITNAGKAHLEGFGGEEGVRKGKGELYDYLRDHGGTVFVMWDYAYLRSMSASIPQRITYGTKEASVEGRISHSHPFLSVDISAGMPFLQLQTRLTGEYNLPNILAAVTVGHYFKIPAEKIKSGIESYQPSNNRSQLIRSGSNSIVLDAYNANPSSMRAAIENLAGFEIPDKVLVLGAMAELGPGSVEEHAGIVSLIRQYPWKQVLLVGGDFSKTDHPFLYFPTAAAAGDWLKQQHFQHTIFLIKGSRSMQMEKALEGLNP